MSCAHMTASHHILTYKLMEAKKHLLTHACQFCCLPTAALFLRISWANKLGCASANTHITQLVSCSNKLITHITSSSSSTSPIYHQVQKEKYLTNLKNEMLNPEFLQSSVLLLNFFTPACPDRFDSGSSPDHSLHININGVFQKNSLYDSDLFILFQYMHFLQT